MIALKSSLPQAKVVSVLQGAGMDGVLDLRASSKTYKKLKVVELGDENNRAVVILAGFGRAFLSMSTSLTNTTKQSIIRILQLR